MKRYIEYPKDAVNPANNNSCINALPPPQVGNLLDLYQNYNTAKWYVQYLHTECQFTERVDNLYPRYEATIRKAIAAVATLPGNQWIIELYTICDELQAIK